MTPFWTLKLSKVSFSLLMSSSFFSECIDFLILFGSCDFHHVQPFPLSWSSFFYMITIIFEYIHLSQNLRLDFKHSEKDLSKEHHSTNLVHIKLLDYLLIIKTMRYRHLEQHLMLLKGYWANNLPHFNADKPSLKLILKKSDKNI